MYWLAPVDSCSSSFLSAVRHFRPPPPTSSDWGRGGSSALHLSSSRDMAWHGYYYRLKMQHCANISPNTDTYKGMCSALICCTGTKNILLFVHRYKCAVPGESFLAVKPVNTSLQREAQLNIALDYQKLLTKTHRLIIYLPAILSLTTRLKVMYGDLGEENGGGYIGSKLDIWS